MENIKKRFNNNAKHLTSLIDHAENCRGCKKNDTCDMTRVRNEKIGALITSQISLGMEAISYEIQ